MRFIAFTTKGLEKVSEKEITDTFKEAKIIEVATKRIIFDSDFNTRLASLKTIDDIGLLVHQSKTMTLDSIVSDISQAGLASAKENIGNFRSLNNTFSLTVGLVGSLKFTAKDVIEKISHQLSKQFGWSFTEFDHQNFDIRIFVDREELYVSVRLTKQSLGKRDYKKVSKAGSLKPTVAAALLLLCANQNKRLRIVDSFCGSGTILCESFVAGHDVFGGDIDSESVRITKENLNTIGCTALDTIKHLDAKRTDWHNDYFDLAISNLPWNEKIKVESITNLYEQSIKEFARILQPQGSLCILVSKPELAVKYIKKFFPTKKIEILKIGLLGQNPTIIVAAPDY